VAYAFTCVDEALMMTHHNDSSCAAGTDTMGSHALMADFPACQPMGDDQYLAFVCDGGVAKNKVYSTSDCTGTPIGTPTLLSCFPNSEVRVLSRPPLVVSQRPLPAAALCLPYLYRLHLGLFQGVLHHRHRAGHRLSEPSTAAVAVAFAFAAATESTTFSTSAQSVTSSAQPAT
jgi:hypothetical protein